jgi:hypothetical protein
MAQEIKNTFLKSKMNKDLDDRILPNGEYRDARNISVGRSEDNDVGALENIIGNALVTGTDLGSGLTVIGIQPDNSGDRMFVFLTDYTDPNPLAPTNAPPAAKNYIYSYNNKNNNYTKLVQGNFLNFSTTNRIIGINLIENLLFWIDNRNQPRKINVDLATAFDPDGVSTITGDYYTEEHQISVAKYNPYQPISLYNRADLQIKTGATTTSFELVGHRATELAGFIGASVVCVETIPATQGTDYVKVISISNSFTPPDETIITVSPGMATAPSGNDIVSLISSTMSNKNDDTTWAGDPDFLEDKFVRFSYRFKFDDNEYSLMAPFTQIAYIPKQNGYFLHGDEDSTYQSTIVDFMENKVQNVGLVIPLPAPANESIRKYKISELEILFRESDSAAVKVLRTISMSDIAGVAGSGNHYTYEYQSKKPYRTLPEAQTVRVYDKVPVRAFSQETAGNRIIYGNFRDQHTPPVSIDYNCKIESKVVTGLFNNFIEYPNHSVKKNRNYQVGFVLADKFGRQSPVILSSNDKGTTEDASFYSGSTIYSPYDILSSDTNPISWFGDAIQVLVNQPISSNIDSSTGTPGLYAIKQQAESTGEGFAIDAPGFSTAGTSPITNTTFTFKLDDDPTTGFPDNINIPREGDSLRGAYEDFVKVTGITGPNATGQYVVTTEGRVSDTYLRNIDLPLTAPDLKFAYEINDLGWYSYKIVVKQNEQDYYNVYLPGILNGYPGQSRPGEDAGGLFPNNEVGLTAHAVLFNDNINKIPRDLAEVGPDQKQFRSSVTLYGIVANTMVSSTEAYNTQYYPRLNYLGKNAVKHTATAIAEAKEFDMGFTRLSSTAGTDVGGKNGGLVFYQIDTNPLIARISTTEKSIGQQNTEDDGVLPYNMLPYLAIYETEPVKSLLDIYWETASSGLIVDLNADVASTNGGVAGFQNIDWLFREDIQPGEAVTVGFFSPIDNQGQPFTNPISASLGPVTNTNGVVQTMFSLIEGTEGGPNEGEFKIIYTDSGEVFEESSILNDIYSFTINCETQDGIVSSIQLIGQQGGFGAFQNLQPSFDVFANKIIDPSQQVIISAPEWAAENPENGTTLLTAKQSELVYTFRELTTTSDPIPVDENGNLLWQMNPINGELTQSTNPGEETPYGIYNIALRLSDANGGSDAIDAPTGYGSLYKERNLQITARPAEVNTPGPLSNSCVIVPDIIPDQGYSSGTNTRLVINPDGSSPVFGYWSNFSNVSCVYYIAAESISPAWPGISPAFAQFAIEENFINQGITKNLGPNSPGGAAAFDKTGVHRIGGDVHRKGTISFTINTYSPRNTNDLTQPNVFSIPLVDFYWRYEGNPQSMGWQEIPRRESNSIYNDFKEQNLVGRDHPLPPGGIVNQTTTNIQAPTSDAPIIESFVNDTGTYYPRTVNDRGLEPVYVQTIRAFDFADFPTYSPSSGLPPGLGIEYAVVVSKMVQDRGGYGPDGQCRTWVQVDDLNFPTCAPWLGKNAVTENGGPGNLFKYFRSVESGSAIDYFTAPTNVPGVNDLFSYSPYGDYVDVFYKAATGFDIFLPTAGSNYLNLRLDRASIGLDSWTTWTRQTSEVPSTEQQQNLQWVAGFDTITGRRLQSPGVNSGVNAMRSLQTPSTTTPAANGIPPIPRGYGTLRIRKSNAG